MRCGQARDAPRMFPAAAAPARNTNSVPQDRAPLLLNKNAQNKLPPERKELFATQPMHGHGGGVAVKRQVRTCTNGAM